MWIVLRDGYFFDKMLRGVGVDGANEGLEQETKCTISMRDDLTLHGCIKLRGYHRRSVVSFAALMFQVITKQRVLSGR